MVLETKRWLSLQTIFVTMAVMGAWQTVAADDLTHAITGVVKSVDKATKTVVIKTGKGAEHTIKYTDDTTVEGVKDAGKGMAKGSEDAAKGVEKGAEDTGKGIGKGSAETFLGAKKGAKVTVKYTEVAGEKTAVGVKDAGKATGKAME